MEKWYSCDELVRPGSTTWPPRYHRVSIIFSVRFPGEDKDKVSKERGILDPLHLSFYSLIEQAGHWLHNLELLFLLTLLLYCDCGLSYHTQFNLRWGTNPGLQVC